MSIDSSEFISQSSNSSGNRAPPPPFSSQTFAQSQRKRPALSNLGIEVSLASDVKTPNTPTPNFTTEQLDSSDAVLKVRPTPTPPIEHQLKNPQVYHEDLNHNHQHQHQHHYQQQEHHYNNHQKHSGYNNHHQTYHNHPSNEIREPQLNTILDALADFQHFYDQKSNRIESLEIQSRKLSELLSQKEFELQACANERIENLRVLESNKRQMRDIEGKIKDFSKYEEIISTKFENLETLMSETTKTKSKYIEKEAELKKDLEAKNKSLNEALKSIQELRIEKESLESVKESLEHENKDRCIEFNGKIYELNTEINEHKRSIDHLTGEKVVLISDLKNITRDRDQIQRECSMALKEITELAVSDSFLGCSSKDLVNLESSVAWIKGKCVELHNSKMSCDLELANLRQTIQELEKHVTMKTDDLKEKSTNLEKMKFDLESKEKEIKRLQGSVDSFENRIASLNDFKERIINLGFTEDEDENLFESVIERLSQKSPDHEIESLTNEITQLKKLHEKELLEQKENYGKLLREESAKWKIQREELENEISELKKGKSSVSSIQTRSKDANLTAIINDLKGSSSDLLISKSSGKRSSSNNITSSVPTLNNNTRYGTNKRRQTGSSITGLSAQNSQKMSSPDSATSTDIWSLFK